MIEKIHGHRIIQASHVVTPLIEGLLPRRVILVDKDSEFVVATHHSTPDWKPGADIVWSREWDHGHYFTHNGDSVARAYALAEAAKFFYEKVKGL